MSTADRTRIETTVRKFKGDRAFRRGLERMTAAGWRVQAQAVRRARWSFVLGLFTRRQIHTVTFVREVRR